jgi:hypothetical protein
LALRSLYFFDTLLGAPCWIFIFYIDADYRFDKLWCRVVMTQSFQVPAGIEDLLFQRGIIAEPTSLRGRYTSMKLLGRITFCALFLLTGALLSMGQENSDKKREFKHKGKIVSKYDKSKDQTTVTLKKMAISSPLAQEVSDLQQVPQLDLEAYFTYPGQQLAKRAETITLVFRTFSKYAVFQRGQNLIGVIEGERALMLGTTNYTSNSQTFGIEEVLSISLPSEALERIANSKNAQIYLGNRQIPLKENHLEALRDMASRMTP